jgi:hypothetical protein
MKLAKVNPEVSMRGMGHFDAIESVTFRHEEGNEGGKIGVKRLFQAFYGAKLLKRKDTHSFITPRRRLADEATV